MSSLRDARMESLLQPLAISLLAFTLGYQTRSYLSTTSPSSSTKPPIASSSSSKPPTKNSKTRATAAEDTVDSSDVESDTSDEAEAITSDLASLKANFTEEVKLVLVVNDSLKMAKGKIAAQAGHATLACAMLMKDANPKLYNRWKQQGQPKIALRCATTEELDELAAQARSRNLCARTIQDAGRTQVAAGSKTILGIGPGPAKIINQITGKLRLL